jgi:hypothetical protein
MGRDVGGQVEAVGKKATQFKPGDEVFGACRGAFAEYACPAEGKLAHWRGAPLPIPYPATRRSWSWDGKAVKQLSEERTGLSVWWKQAGWRRLTRLSSRTRR